MISRLALGEPVATIRLPRIRSKTERLREAATAYVDKHYPGPRRPYARNTPEQEQRAKETYAARRAAWIQIRLNEREAVLAKVNRVPWWQFRLRRLVLQRLLETHRVPKWW